METAIAKLAATEETGTATATAIATAITEAAAAGMGTATAETEAAMAGMGAATAGPGVGAAEEEGVTVVMVATVAMGGMAAEEVASESRGGDQISGSFQFTASGRLIASEVHRSPQAGQPKSQCAISMATRRPSLRSRRILAGNRICRFRSLDDPSSMPLSR